jgi:branched-chain amino acid transport system permease protein
MDILGLYITDALWATFLINVVLAYSAYAALLGGSFNLAFPAFIAVGAYSTAILTLKWGWPDWSAVVVGIIVSVAVGVGLGILLRKLGGVFLAIATVSVLFLVQIIGNDWTSVTGGSAGLVGITGSVGGTQLLIVVVVLAIGFLLFQRSRYGLAVALRREDPLLGESMGFNARTSGLVLVAASATIAAVGGTLRAHYFGFVQPDEYGLTLVVSLIAMVVLGGVGSWAGPVIGAAFFTLVPEWASGLGDWRDLITAGILLIVVRYAPDGVAGSVTRLIAARRMKQSRAQTFDASLGEEDPDEDDRELEVGVPVSPGTRAPIDRLGHS